jgi:rubrerythrin
MQEFKSVKDIIDFAINEEIGAQKFYKDLATKMNNSTMRKVFEDFAREEKGHEEKLKAIKAGKQMPADFLQPVADLKLADYLTDIEPSADMTYQSALVVAMKKEKSAYKLYIDLANKVSDQNHKNLFLSLAQEEANHKLRFEIEYDNAVFEGN